MVKLKCWKLTKKQGISIYDKGKTKIIVTPFEAPKHKYQTVVFRPKRNPINKFFKRKSSAIKFAKKYMKKHNVCKIK